MTGAVSRSSDRLGRRVADGEHAYAPIETAASGAATLPEEPRFARLLHYVIALNSDERIQ